jgi:hypothetical protein
MEGSGAAYYIFAMGASVDQSYLGRALNGTSMLTGAAIASDARLREWVSERIVVVAILLGIASFALLTLHSLNLVLTEFNQILRIQTSYLMAGLAWFLIRRPSVPMSAFVVLLMALNGVMSGKSTHLIIGLIFGLVTIGRPVISRLFAFAARSTDRGRQFIYFCASLLIGLFLFLSVNIFAQIVSERANRNEYDVRKIGFEYRWEQFQQSPIYGKLFIDTPNVANVFSFGDNVPSHNDIMDILAAGGLIALTLFAIIIFKSVLGRGFVEVLTFRPRQIKPVHYFWLVTIFYAVAATGNPFFSEPYMAVPVWFSIGMMLGYRKGN